jgi:hypothetical protein
LPVLNGPHGSDEYLPRSGRLQSRISKLGSILARDRNAIEMRIQPFIESPKMQEFDMRSGY